jgi:hypothetical protein
VECDGDVLFNFRFSEVWETRRREWRVKCLGTHVDMTVLDLRSPKSQ